MYKPIQVVILPVEKAIDDDDKYSSFIGILRGIEDDEINSKSIQGAIVYNSGFGYFNPCWQPQHIYLLSDDKIKEGDFFFANQAAHKCIEVRQGTTFQNVFIPEYYPYMDENRICHHKSWKKIVATTDQSLNLPTLSEKDLNLFCEGSKRRDTIDVKHDENNKIFVNKFKHILIKF